MSDLGHGVGDVFSLLSEHGAGDVFSLLSEHGVGYICGLLLEHVGKSCVLTLVWDEGKRSRSNDELRGGHILAAGPRTSRSAHAPLIQVDANGPWKMTRSR